MKTTQNRGLTFFRTAGLLAVLVALLLPASASAADSIYWSNEDGSNSIRYGPLSGDNGGSTPAQTLFNDGGRPCGVALNPAAGKAYWANWDSGEIRVANLNGTGVANTLFDDGFVNVCGVAVDPANNKIYWANFSTQQIRVGNLDGTGTASTLFTDPGGSDPSGVAIDPADNKIYWTNQHSHQVRVGNLDGTGSASTLFGGDATVPTTENNPIGVAVDPAAGKVYWTNLVGGQVRVGPLGGSSVGPPSTLFTGTPSGPSVDPTANKIYWASWTSGSGIRVGNLDGTGTASTLFGGESSSLFTALLRKPAFTERPAISGGAKVGRELTCRASFAPDLLGAFLYRAPASVDYQWKKGAAIVASGPTFTPTEAGDYTCTVAATNQVGDTVQTSAVKKVKAH
jgi:DNA-binding beta-propeller fold protein YncE